MFLCCVDPNQHNTVKLDENLQSLKLDWTSFMLDSKVPQLRTGLL